MTSRWRLASLAAAYAQTTAPNELRHHESVRQMKMRRVLLPSYSTVTVIHEQKRDLGSLHDVRE